MGDLVEPVTLASLDVLLPKRRSMRILRHAPIRDGATLAEAHVQWPESAIAKLETPSGLPRRPDDDRCPPGLRRVSVDCVTAVRGDYRNMYYAFDGFYLSMLVCYAGDVIWDARGEWTST